MAETSIAWLFGVITGITGLLFAAAGSLEEDVTPETMGMVRGLVSYALGTRRLGAAGRRYGARVGVRDGVPEPCRMGMVVRYREEANRA